MNLSTTHHKGSSSKASSRANVRAKDLLIDLKMIESKIFAGSRAASRRILSRTRDPLARTRRTAIITSRTDDTALDRRCQHPIIGIRTLSSTKVSSAVDTAVSSPKDLWNSYMQHGGSPLELFRVIDLNANHKISARELQTFVDHVLQRQNISAEGLQLLADLVHENEDYPHQHELDEQEFRQWLNVATLPSPASSLDDSTNTSMLQTAQSKALDVHEADGTAMNHLRLKAKRNCKLMNLVWDQYLRGESPCASGKATGAEVVFSIVDLDRNSKISLLELQLFFESIHYKHIDRARWQQLQSQHSQDYELEFAEFEAFLVAACEAEQEEDEPL